MLSLNISVKHVRSLLTPYLGGRAGVLAEGRLANTKHKINKKYKITLT
jgi:hypothetical protein